MNITDFYQQARNLLGDVKMGKIDPESLSDEGRLALDIAANKISVNDLSNEGRQAIGIDPLPQPQGVVTSDIPFGSKVGQAALDVTAGVIKSLGLDTLAARTGELATGALSALKEIPGQISRGGESFRQAGELAMQGQFGHAAAELGGGVAETGNALLGLGAPLTIPLAAPAAATGMAAEQIAKWAGLPEKFNVGAAELTPRGIGELAGMALPGAAGIVAGKTPRIRMPAITDPELAHLKYGMLHERINVSEAAKNPNIGEGTRAQLNARAATLRQAERELAKGTYSTKSDLFKILYDETSAEARDAATRTQYVEPNPAAREATVQPGGAVNVTGRESPMGAMAPGVADIAEAERAQARQLAESVGLDPNLYGGPAEAPATPAIETPTVRPAGPVGPVATEPYPGLREVAPESLEGAIAETLKPRTPPEGEAQFPSMYGVQFQDLGKGAPKGKTKKGPKGKRSQLVQIIKTANPEMSTSAAVKVADITEKAAAKAEATQAAIELPTARVKKKVTVADVTPVEPTPAEIVQDAKAAVDNVVMDDATARIEAQPPVAEAIRPEPMPTPEAPGSTIISDAPPVESAAPVPAQTRATKPTGAEKYFRETTKRKLLAMGFENAQVERMWQAIQADPSLRQGVSEMLRKWRKQNKTASDFIQSAHEGGRIDVQVEKEVINELAGQARIGAAGGEPTVPQLGEFWRPPEGVAQATAAPIVKPSASTLPETTRLSFRSVNDTLRDRGRKLVISTEADPGKPAETVFLLRKLNGEPVINERTGQPVSYRTPEAALEATLLEGPGAMVLTPDGIAQMGLTGEAKSANLTVQKLFRAAGIEQGDLGFFTSHFRLNTPGFVTRFDPNAHLIFSHGVDMAMRARKFKNAIMKRVYEISEQLDSPKEADDLFLMGKVREMKPEQAKAFLAQVSPKIKRLWELHRALDDEVFNQIKRSDPTVNYRRDHITQFPLDAAIEQYYNDLKHAKDMANQFPNDKARYEEQVKEYERLIKRITEQRNSIENMRFERQPDGSYFGPLNEARMLNLDYSRSYIGVMERYLDGVERKLFLDRTLPVFKRYMKADSLANKPLMRLYLHDWMNNLRGMYGRRWRMSIENSLEAFGVDNPFERQRWASDFDSMINVVNGGQAILYMGLRAKSVLNNMFQTLMTTYPEVGARSYAHGLAQLFTKRGREFARQIGVVDFVPDNLGELYREASDAFQTRNPLKILNATTTAGVRVALRPFQLIEIGNNIISANAGFHYARNVLKMDPFKAAEYAKAMALRTNYIMHQINTPMAFTGPLGKMGGFLQRFKVNFTEQLLQNYERFMKGERGPFIRQLGVYLALTGTEGLVLYNLAADQAMKRFGKEWPRFNPLQWAMNQAGVAGGEFFENMAPSLAIFTPGAGGDVTSIFKPVIAQTLQNIATQGPAAFVPSSVRDVARAFVEMGRGSAESTRTGRTIAHRPTSEVLASSVGLQPWAEGLRNRYLGQIAAAMEGGRVDVAMRLANEARQRGLRITGNEVQAIRRSARERGRGSSTAGQLTQQLLQSLGIR